MNTVELSNLRFSHDPDAPAGLINPRRTNRTEGIDQLAASIMAHGIIQPLAVVKAGVPTLYYVAEGNRRLTALQQLRDAGSIDDAFPVPVSFLRPDVDFAEAALAANIVRVPLHEADQYEAFTALADDGLSEEEIASRFGIEPRRVRRILALGRLSPLILQAWRDGTFGQDEINCVRAFTLAPSFAEQERVFNKLLATRGFWAHGIRAEFGAGKGDAAKHLTFVGRDAYEAAGGIMIEDLFGDNHVVTDPALAKRLADEKLLAVCAELRAEGWSWAEPVSALPDGAKWSWATLPGRDTQTEEESARLAELQDLVDSDDELPSEEIDTAREEIDRILDAIDARGFDDEAKAKAGCIVSIGYNGELEIKRGVVRPGSGKAKAAAKTAPAKKDEPAVSNALAHRLSVQLTQAVQQALPASPLTALAALVAGMLSGGSYGCPVRLRLEGLNASAPRPGEHFTDAFARLQAMEEHELVAACAHALCFAIDMQTQNAASPAVKNGEFAALFNALDPTALNQALRRQFDAEDYFRNVGKPLVLKAIEEALNADEATKVKSRPKGELVEFALANVPETGWLPPELRTAHYDGPGASAPGKSKGKAKARNPAAAKKAAGGAKKTRKPRS